MGKASADKKKSGSTASGGGSKDPKEKYETALKRAEEAMKDQDEVSVCVHVVCWWCVCVCVCVCVCETVTEEREREMREER